MRTTDFPFDSTSVDLGGDLGSNMGSLSDSGGAIDPSFDLGNPSLADFANEDLGAFTNTDSTTAVATSNSGNPSALGSFFSSLATDASSILSGAVAGVQQTQAIDRAKQLAANGYTVPLNMPGLGGSFNAQTILLWGLLIFLAAKLLK